MKKNINCPLCNLTENYKFHTDKWREYYRCENCDLTFVPPVFYLTADEEKSRYDTHQNSPDDFGYRKFLSRMFIPLKDRIKSDSVGLDFGSGPGPTLSVMFQEAGYKMNIYDIFYANDKAIMNQKYDFITCTEVVEHLHNPMQEFKLFWDILKVNGYLGIMTKLTLDIRAFQKWHYIRDLTHVCFFSKQTFIWLGEYLDAQVTFLGKDIVLFNKI